MTKMITTAAVLGLSLMAATPAFAGETEAQVRIPLSGLDLASPKAKRILALRIHRAAVANCTSGLEGLDAGVRRAQSRCTKAVTAKAMAAADARIGQQLAGR